MSEIMVSVEITTYNQEEYIADAIEGVLLQKTSFPIEIIIHDDASTDGTAEIVKSYAEKYPQIIVPICQEENQFSKGVNIELDILSKIRKGKYVAFCEGDDYWIDENKLQKQIDFMETHPEYSLCMHNAWKYDMNSGEKTLLNTFPVSGSYPLSEQVKVGLGSNFPATASYLKRCFEPDEDIHSLFNGIVGDYQTRVFTAKYGNVFYFEEPMSVYRYAAKSSFTEKIKSDSRYYIKYICDMEKTYAAMNMFLAYQFDDIYNKKICSDYLGLAARVISENIYDIVEDIVGESFNWELYEKYLELLDIKTMRVDLDRFVQKAELLYLYGTSPLAVTIYNKLVNHGYDIDGFIVSDGYSKPDELCGKKTVYLSDIKHIANKVSIILSVQPINEIDIKKNIEKYIGVKTFSLS